MACVRAGHRHLRLSARVRVDIVAKVGRAGSVIVGVTNGRGFEPAPGRNGMMNTRFTVSF